MNKNVKRELFPLIVRLDLILTKHEDNDNSSYKKIEKAMERLHDAPDYKEIKSAIERLDNAPHHKKIETAIILLQDIPDLKEIKAEINILQNIPKYKKIETGIKLLHKMSDYEEIESAIKRIYSNIPDLRETETTINNCLQDILDVLGISDYEKVELAKILLYDIVKADMEIEYTTQKIDMLFNSLIEQNEEMEKYLNRPKGEGRKSKTAASYEKILERESTDKLIEIRDFMKQVYIDLHNGNRSFSRDKIDYYKALLDYNNIKQVEILQEIKNEYSKDPDNRDPLEFIKNNFENTLYKKKELDENFWNVLLKCFLIVNERKNGKENIIQEIDPKQYFKQQCVKLFVSENHDIAKKYTPAESARIKNVIQRNM